MESQEITTSRTSTRSDRADHKSLHKYGPHSARIRHVGQKRFSGSSPSSAAFGFSRLQCQPSSGPICDHLVAAQAINPASITSEQQDQKKVLTAEEWKQEIIQVQQGKTTMSDENAWDSLIALAWEDCREEQQVEQERKARQETRRKKSGDQSDHECTDSEDNESLEFTEPYGMHMMYEKPNPGTTWEEFQTAWKSRFDNPYMSAIRNGQMSRASVPVFMHMPVGSSEVITWAAENHTAQVLKDLAHFQNFGLGMVTQQPQVQTASSSDGQQPTMTTTDQETTTTVVQEQPPQEPPNPNQAGSSGDQGGHDGNQNQPTTPEPQNDVVSSIQRDEWTLKFNDLNSCHRVYNRFFKRFNMDVLDLFESQTFSHLHDNLRDIQTTVIKSIATRTPTYVDAYVWFGSTFTVVTGEEWDYLCKVRQWDFPNRYLWFHVHFHASPPHALEQRSWLENNSHKKYIKTSTEYVIIETRFNKKDWLDRAINSPPF